MNDPSYLLAKRPNREINTAAFRQLEVSATLNAECNRERLKEMLLRNPEALIWLLSQYYPLDAGLLELYADFLEWEDLSRNEALPWSIELIERYADRWEWIGLSGNKADRKSVV